MRTRKRGLLSVGKLFLVSVALCLATACVSDRAPSSSQGPEVSIDGLGAKLTDEQLTARAPLVVEGLVSARDIVALADDPSLPPIADEETRQIVQSGKRRIKWQVTVQKWTKGNSPAEIIAVRGLSEEDVHSADLPEEGSLPSEFSGIEAGKKYTMWLEPDEWFKQDHWILVRALPVGGA